MTPPDIVDKIRLEILTQTYATRPASRSAEQMLKLARRDDPTAFGPVTVFEFAREAHYLEGRGHLERLQGLLRWSISSAGIEWMENEGLAT